jgi:hypothetical protein
MALHSMGEEANNSNPASCPGASTFFGKNQFNLAKGLKATQVHDSDTPSLSQRDRWESGQYIIT